MHGDVTVLTKEKSNLTRAFAFKRSTTGTSTSTVWPSSALLRICWRQHVTWRSSPLARALKRSAFCCTSEPVTSILPSNWPSRRVNTRRSRVSQHVALTPPVTPSWYESVPTSLCKTVNSIELSNSSLQESRYDLASYDLALHPFILS